jgi:hypothetical protein
MSLFGKLVRGAAAATFVTLGTTATTAQEPAVPATLPEGSGRWLQSQVAPAGGFGRGAGARCAPACPPAPCFPGTTYPATPGMPGTPPPVSSVPPLTGTTQPPSVEAPDFGDLGRGAGVGPVVGLNGYIENAAPVTMARLRFDAAYGNNRPDRAEVFYAKCGCFLTPDALGPPLPERNIDYQELTPSIEYAFSRRFSAFVNIPVRFLNPDANRNQAGLSDIGFGTKYAFVSNECRVVTLMLRAQAPAGSMVRGLGNGNWWLEPGLLYLEQLTPRWQGFGEFRFQFPLGTRSDFTGNFLRYGLGTSYIVADGQWGYVAPVVEAVAWTVLSGKESDAFGSTASAAGDTIVNAKLGVRIGLGAPALGTPYPTRSDLYIGYGRTLTGEVWYKDLLRLEYRLFF